MQKKADISENQNNESKESTFLKLKMKKNPSLFTNFKASRTFKMKLFAMKLL